MESASFWDDNNAAQQVISEANGLRAWIIPYKELSQRFDNVKELLPEAVESNDQHFTDQLISATC